MRITFMFKDELDNSYILKRNIIAQHKANITQENINGALKEILTENPELRETDLVCTFEGIVNFFQIEKPFKL